MRKILVLVVFSYVLLTVCSNYSDSRHNSGHVNDGRGNWWSKNSREQNSQPRETTRTRDAEQNQNTDRCSLSSAEQILKLLFEKMTQPARAEMLRKLAELYGNFTDENSEKAMVKLPHCTDTTRAMDVILDKMWKESNIFAENYQTSNATWLVTTLDNLNRLRNRAINFGLEARTEPVDTCSNYLTDKLENLTFTLNKAENTLQTRLRDFRVTDAVRNIKNGQGESLEKSLVLLESLELDLTLRDVIQELLPSNADHGLNDAHLSHILAFLQLASPQSQIRKTCLALIVDEYKSRRLERTNQFLNLALESKITSDIVLKNKFPLSIQRLIWDGFGCLQNRRSGEYLLEESGYTLARALPQNGNESQFELSQDQETHHLPAVTRNPGIKTQASCGWEIHPLLRSPTHINSLKFIVRRLTESENGWQLSSDGQHVWLSHSRVNPENTWELTFSSNTTFTIKSQRQRQDRKQNLSYLCYMSNGVVELNRFTRDECEWVLDPFTSPGRHNPGFQ